MKTTNRHKFSTMFSYRSSFSKSTDPPVTKTKDLLQPATSQGTMIAVDDSDTRIADHKLSYDNEEQDMFEILPGETTVVHDDEYDDNSVPSLAPRDLTDSILDDVPTLRSSVGLTSPPRFDHSPVVVEPLPDKVAIIEEEKEDPMPPPLEQQEPLEDQNLLVTSTSDLEPLLVQLDDAQKVSINERVHQRTLTEDDVLLDPCPRASALQLVGRTFFAFIFVVSLALPLSRIGSGATLSLPNLPTHYDTHPMPAKPPAEQSTPTPSLIQYSTDMQSTINNNQPVAKGGGIHSVKPPLSSLVSVAYGATSFPEDKIFAATLDLARQATGKGWWLAFSPFSSLAWEEKQTLGWWTTMRLSMQVLLVLGLITMALAGRGRRFAPPTLLSVSQLVKVKKVPTLHKEENDFSDYRVLYQFQLDFEKVKTDVGRRSKNLTLLLDEFGIDGDAYATLTIEEIRSILPYLPGHAIVSASKTVLVEGLLNRYSFTLSRFTKNQLVGLLHLKHQDVPSRFTKAELVHMALQAGF
jgi:hypothetical protein